MLRPSVMGSDLSYGDMMDDTPLKEQYKAIVNGEEMLEGRKCWVVNITAIVTDINYFSQKYWVDRERYVPLKMQLFAKSGKQLKEFMLSDVKKIQGRWYPKRMVYKDMLKEGNGTTFIISDVQFNTTIPANIFNKSSLK